LIIGKSGIKEVEVVSGKAEDAVLENGIGET